MVFRAVRSVCLYSSGVSYAIVKMIFQQIFAFARGLAELCKSFHPVPELGSSRLLSTHLPEAVRDPCQRHLRQCCEAKSLEYLHKYIYPNGIHASHIAPRASPRIPVLALTLASMHSRLQVPRVAPPSSPLLQLTFCGTRLRSTGQFRLHLPSLPDRFCACGGVRPVRRETTRGEI